MRTRDTVSSDSEGARTELRARSLVATDVWVVIFVLAVGNMLGWLSVARYEAYNAGMLDLGNMSQAIWSATQGRPLECTYGDGPLSRLALHVELIYFLFAPIYALFSSPVTLVVLQAGLFAAGGFPLYALAHRRLQHRWAARLIVLTYLLYPVAQTAVLFDFHGDTLAMPLLLFAFEALDRKAYKAYGLWLILSLSCKFYVAVPVIVFGLVLYATGQRRVGALTSWAAGAWFLVTVALIRPAFAPTGYVPPEATASGYLVHLFRAGAARCLHDLMRSRRVSWSHSSSLRQPYGWLAARWCGWSPAAAVALPAVVASGLVSAADYTLHHYALAVPFLVLAGLEGADHLRRKRPLTWRLDVGDAACYRGALLRTTRGYTAQPSILDQPVGMGPRCPGLRRHAAGPTQDDVVGRERAGPGAPGGLVLPCATPGQPIGAVPSAGPR